MVRIVNPDGLYLKIPMDWRAFEWLIPPEVIEWVGWPEEATLFKHELEAERVADLVSDATGGKCIPVYLRPEEGVFVISHPSLGILLNDGSWEYADAECRRYTDPEGITDVSRFAWWFSRDQAEAYLFRLIKDGSFQSKVLTGWGRLDWSLFRVDHVAEIFGQDPAVWEKENQTPFLPGDQLHSENESPEGNPSS